MHSLSGPSYAPPGRPSSSGDRYAMLTLFEMSTLEMWLPGDPIAASGGSSYLWRPSDLWKPF